MPAEHRCTYNTLMQVLAAQYGIEARDPLEVYSDLGLKQRDSESVAEYSQKVIQTLMNAKITDEHLQMFFFLTGLQTEITSRLYLMSHNTLGQLEKNALKVEKALKLERGSALNDIQQSLSTLNSHVEALQKHVYAY